MAGILGDVVVWLYLILLVIRYVKEGVLEYVVSLD